jgi:hypothetical protein
MPEATPADHLEFLVQGSAPEPYRTIIERRGNNLTATCTCPAGQNGIYCKHRIRILQGITENVVSNNLEEVAVVASWLPGTDVQKAIVEVSEAQQVLTMAEKNLAAAKKRFAQSLRD